MAQEDWQDSTLLDRQTSSPTSDAQRKAEKIPCNACQVETDTLQPQSFSMFSTGSEACCTEASGQETELKHAKKRVQLNSRLQGMRTSQHTTRTLKTSTHVRNARPRIRELGNSFCSNGQELA